MSFESPQKSVGEAMAIIQAVKAEVHAMGANDSEFSDLAEIQSSLESGEMSAEDAIAAAYAVRDFKQDYH